MAMAMATPPPAHMAMELAHLAKNESNLSHASPPNFRNDEYPLPQRSSRRSTVVSLLVGFLLSGFVVGVSTTKRKRTTTIGDDYSSNNNGGIHNDNNGTIAMAFCGNSMTYYNDLPRLVELILLRNESGDGNVNGTADASGAAPRRQDSCLRGGANLASLWEDGNGMGDRFAGNDTGAPDVASLLGERRWSAVVLQDDEQYATDALPRHVSLGALRDSYLPQIAQRQQQQQQPSSFDHGDGDGDGGATTTILLLESFPYQSARLRRKILGLPDFRETAEAIMEGYQAYADALREWQGGRLPVRVVPVAAAVASIYDDDGDDRRRFPEDLWNALYSDDGVHPSPHATWLVACLVVATATGRDPPAYDGELQSAWWDRARHWANNNTERRGTRHWGQDDDCNGRLPPPTPLEAEALRMLACRVVLRRDCG